MSPSRYAAASVTGPREKNDDRWSADPDAGLFVVSDGIGSASHGGLAAQVVVDRLPAYLAAQRARPGRADPRHWLPAAIAHLSDELHRRSVGPDGLTGTTATVVAALNTGRDCVVAHLGDSPAYLLRDGQLTCLTTDHTIARVLMDAGAITADEALAHPGRNKLTRHVGMEPPAHPDVTQVELHPGDRLLLCSDGISGVLGEDTLRDVLSSAGDPEATCAALIEAATNADSTDNMTVVVVEFDLLPMSSDTAEGLRIRREIRGYT